MPKLLAAGYSVVVYDLMLFGSDGLPKHSNLEVIEGDLDGWEFVAAYGCAGRTVAVLATTPGRVHAYRDAISKRADFPPRNPD